MHSPDPYADAPPPQFDDMPNYDYEEEPSASPLFSGFPTNQSPNQQNNKPTSEPFTPPTLEQARATLQRVFGYPDFLTGQTAVIKNVLHGRDTLNIMPTGGGKSLCYQLPALLFPGLTVVVSPLISLMQDQVDQLREWGVSAAALNSTLPYAAQDDIRTAVYQGQLQLLYLAPETLMRPDTLTLLTNSHISLLAIDEAHCISAWGHDFRPEYRQLHAVRQYLPDTPCLALTATATERVRQDIRDLLHIPPEHEFIASFDRPNLFLAAEPRRGGLDQITTFLQGHKEEAGIIYCTTRRQVDELTGHLQHLGYNVLPYHAGIDSRTRELNQRRFSRDEIDIIVATVAFGMGIDKSNVRFVVHYNLPKDIESYYQEIGRAGRDGLPATCQLLYSQQDVNTLQRIMARDENGGQSNGEQGREANLRLQAMWRYAHNQQCRRHDLLGYFGETYAQEACETCDNCRQTTPTEQADLTVPAQKFLSCAVRTEQIFGMSHLISVLRGSRSRKVLQKGHDKLSTYGIGQEYSKAQWQEMAHQFIQAGLLTQDLQYGSLMVTEAGWAVMRREEKFMGTPPAVETGSMGEPTAVFTSHRYPELFAQLRAKRTELATANNLPAYIVFSDRSLAEMATYLPTTAVELSHIHGVGEAKVAKYADDFLPLIHAFRQAHPDATPRPSTNTSHRSTIHTPTSTVNGTLPDGETAQTIRLVVAQQANRPAGVAAAYEVGYATDEIAAALGIKQGTVVSNLEKHLMETGLATILPERLRAESTLDTATWERVRDSFAELGSERLKPTFEALQEAVSYDDLRLARLIFWLEQA